MKKSIDSLKEKMAAFQVTGNTDYDFAMMTRMQRQVELGIAKAELEHGKNQCYAAWQAELLSRKKMKSSCWTNGGAVS